MVFTFGLRPRFTAMTFSRDRRGLPPANAVWGKVMFLHLSVILFTGGGVYTPWASTPWADSP